MSQTRHVILPMRSWRLKTLCAEQRIKESFLKKKKKSVSPSDTFRLFMYPSNKATDDVIQGRNTNVIPSTTILFMNNFLPTIWNMISDKSYRLTETLNEVFLLLLLLLLNPSSHVQLCATLWTVAHQAPLTMEFSSQEYWCGLPCPLPRDLPNPGIKPGSPA